MSKPRPLSESSPEPAAELEASDPLGLAPEKRAKRPSGSVVAIVAGVAAVALAVGLIVWLWQWKGHSALVPTAGVVEPDPDPPVVALTPKDLVKPATNDLPARPSLDKRLDALLVAAASLMPETENQAATNERIQRWEIRFPNGNTSETYARQLDALGIELGVIGGGERITYASAFTKEQPQRHDGPAADEQRFYMTWRSGALRDLDNALLSRAKIQTSERIVAQFYPPQLERSLADMEKQFAAPRDLAEVRHTVFALVAADKGYQFRVAEQEYVTGEVKNADAKPAAKPDKPPPAKR